jgi:Uma2 family endonuclease
MALARPTPKTGSWTYADLEARPDDGKRYEIIDGVLFEMTGSNMRHGDTAHNLTELLRPYVRALGGRLYNPIVDVFFPGADPVQPDIFLLLPGGATYRSERGVEGIPDLIVEVLSPSNRRHDALTKRDLYERAGLREYWLVDPAVETVEVLALVDGRFQRLGLFSGAATVASTVLPDLAFAAADVFAGFEDIRPAPAEA